jgi:hypothetical protein
MRMKTEVKIPAGQAALDGQLMRCEVKLEIIPHATHLFEEPGALEQVAQLASDWFVSRVD